MVAGSNPVPRAKRHMNTTKYIRHFNPNTFIIWSLDSWGFLHYKIVEAEHGNRTNNQ